MFVLVC